MKQRLTNLLKYNRTVYSFYYYVMNFALRVLSLFVRQDDSIILFNSYAGRKYDDSPRAIYEAMIQDSRFKGKRIIWAFHEPEKYPELIAEKVKTDTLQYFVIALRAKVWVTNSSVERGLKFKKKGTLYFNTWHGTPIKIMGSDLKQDNQSFAPKSESVDDVRMSQSEFETEVFSRSFHIPKNHFLEAGLPRNDELAHVTAGVKQKIRAELGIAEGKKVLLYCPTFREYEKDEKLGVVSKPPIDLKKWQQVLGDNYVLLFRAHYEVSKVLGIKENEFVLDMTSYPRLNDLMIAADILISDYSSVFFDYAITGKPMLHYCYDYDVYSQHRGMYFDIRDYIGGAENEGALLECIVNINMSESEQKTVVFRDKFVNRYGNATQAALDCIAAHVRE